MNFPEQVLFRLIDSVTKRPVDNIAVSLVLYASRKNNYYVGPILTNREGIVVFKRDQCVKEIDNSRKFYLMDYSSTIEECLPKCSLKIKPRTEMVIAVNNMRNMREIYEKYWDCSETYIKSLESADNAKYVSKTYDFSESDIWKNNVIDLSVEPV